MTTRIDHAREIRARLDDPRALCDALGLIDRQTKKQARGIIVHCPAHDDRSPSCSVRIESDGTIAATCFSCGWRGDALGLVAEVRGLDLRRDFPAVLAEAASIAGYEMRDDEPRASAPRPKVDPTLDLARRIDAAADDYLRGRPVRPDPVLESAPIGQLALAFDVLATADDLDRAMTEERDREMDRLADEWEARS